MDQSVITFSTTGLNPIHSSAQFDVTDPGNLTFDAYSIGVISGGAINDGKGGNLASGSSTSGSLLARNASWCPATAFGTLRRHGVTRAAARVRQSAVRSQSQSVGPGQLAGHRVRSSLILGHAPPSLHHRADDCPRVVRDDRLGAGFFAGGSEGGDTRAHARERYRRALPWSCRIIPVFCCSRSLKPRLVPTPTDVARQRYRRPTAWW